MMVMVMVMMCGCDGWYGHRRLELQTTLVTHLLLAHLLTYSAKLEAMVQDAVLTDLPELGAQILAGAVRGRVVVDVNA